MPSIEQGGSQNLNTTSSGTLIVTTRTPLLALTPTFATVGNTSALALASNTNRKGLIIENITQDTVSIAFGATAVLYSGITLPPLSAYNTDEYCFDTGAVYAISSGSATNINIQEFQ